MMTSEAAQAGPIQGRLSNRTLSVIRKRETLTCSVSVQYSPERNRILVFSPKTGPAEMGVSGQDPRLVSNRVRPLAIMTTVTNVVPVERVASGGILIGGGRFVNGRSLARQPNRVERHSMTLAGNAVVTGASSGLGRELARQLVEERGMTVLATARRLDRLEVLAAELPPGRLQVLAGDLADAGFRQRLWDRAEGRQQTRRQRACARSARSASGVIALNGFFERSHEMSSFSLGLQPGDECFGVGLAGIVKSRHGSSADIADGPDDSHPRRSRRLGA